MLTMRAADLRASTGQSYVGVKVAIRAAIWFVLASLAVEAGPAHAQSRTLDRDIISCKRREGTNWNYGVYYGRFDVQNGRLVVNGRYQAVDSQGNRFVVDAGETSVTSFAYPLVGGFYNGGQAVFDNIWKLNGLFVRQATYPVRIDGKMPIALYMMGTMTIPGLTQDAGDKGEVVMEFLKDNRVIWRSEPSGYMLYTYDAPKLTLNQYFNDGEEKAWLKGRVDMRITYRGQRYAQFQFNFAPLDSAGMKARHDAGLIGQVYQPNALPEGCQRIRIED